MTTPATRRTAAESAYKMFVHTAGVLALINLAIFVLKPAVNVYSPAAQLAVAGLIMFCGAGALVSKGVVLVQRKPTSQWSLYQNAQTPGMAPGWYSDPSDPSLRRYFDGQTWTSGTAPRD